VESIANAYLGATHRAGRASVVALVRFLRRFVQGEEPLPALFTDTVALLPLLKRLSDMQQGDELMTIFELRALHQLGYLSSSAVALDVIKAPTIEAVTQVSGLATDIRISQQIVSAKAASQL